MTLDPGRRSADASQPLDAAAPESPPAKHETATRPPGESDARRGRTAGAAFPSRWKGLAGVGLSVFMFTLDGSAANVALPALAHAFDASLATVQWVVVAYLLALTTLVLGAARLGDRIGRKRAYLAGIAIFAVGGCACALAPSIAALIAARALQGVGAVFLSALSGAIVAQTFPSEERGRALGIVAALVFGGLALGPTVGGFVLGAFGWHGVFLTSVPIALVALVVVARVIPDLPPVSRRGGFDWAGAVTLAASLAALALGLTLAQSRGFAALVVLGLIALACGGLALFVVLQKRTAVPLVDLRLLRRPSIGLGLLLALLVYLVLSGSTLVLPFYLAIVLHYSPAKMGMLMAASPLVGMLAAPLGGALADRIGARRLTLFATVALAIGCAAARHARSVAGRVGLRGAHHPLRTRHRDVQHRQQQLGAERGTTRGTRHRLRPAVARAHPRPVGRRAAHGRSVRGDRARRGRRDRSGRPAAPAGSATGARDAARVRRRDRACARRRRPRRAAPAPRTAARGDAGGRPPASLKITKPADGRFRRDAPSPANAGDGLVVRATRSRTYNYGCSIGAS